MMLARALIALTTLASGLAAPIVSPQPGLVRQTALLRWSPLGRSVHSAIPLSEAAIAAAIPGAVESDVDIWGVRPEHSGVVVMLRAEHVRYLQTHRDTAPLEVVSILLKDVDKVVEEQARVRSSGGGGGGGGGGGTLPAGQHTQRAADSGRRQLPEFFDEYRELEAVYDYLELLALEHPSLVRHIPSIGQSFEGRPIPAVAVGGVDGGPAVYIQVDKLLFSYV